jgi:hypothetical protein
VLAKMHETGRVLEQRYTDEGVVVEYQSDAENVERLRRELED